MIQTTNQRPTSESANRRMMGWAHVRMYERVQNLSITQPINQRRNGRIGCPFTEARTERPDE